MSQDIIDRIAGSPLNRRTFAVTSLATGFALSVQPISAAVITTDATGLETGEAKIPVSDGEIPAYWAKPAKGTTLGTILVVQEIFGVHEWIKDICRRFAKEGYFAVAPALYARQGDPTSYTDIQKLVSEIVSKVDDAVVMTDLDGEMGGGQRRRYGEARRDGFLLGRADHLALHRLQSEREGGCCLVRADGSAGG